MSLLSFCQCFIFSMISYYCLFIALCVLSTQLPEQLCYYFCQQQSHCKIFFQLHSLHFKIRILVLYDWNKPSKTFSKSIWVVYFHSTHTEDYLFFYLGKTTWIQTHSQDANLENVHRCISFDLRCIFMFGEKRMGVFPLNV